MKRTRAQNPKLQAPQEPTATNASAAKPQRRAKQPRQPKAAGGKKTARVAAAAAAATAAAGGGANSAGAEMAPSVPDVYAGADEATAAQTAEWDLDGGLSAAGSWWTFGVDEEKLLGWFPFVEEDFPCLGAGRGDADAAAFDDDIWRIHQIYEIPNYAAK